jgi:hypothetical protein
MGWVEEEELKATEYLFDSEGNHVMQYPMDADGSPDLSKKQKKVRVPKKSYWGCWKVAETLNVVVDGFRFDFGTGGIHGSVSNKVIKENAKWGLIDLDVASFYPNLAISNRVYPEHLGETFCDIYKSMYDERKIHKKGSAENAMLKLALNGTYGKSNDKYSVFYDPKFTMTITIGGQLALCMLVDMFYQHNMRFKMIMANTDGITLCVHRSDYEVMDNVVKQWEDLVSSEVPKLSDFKYKLNGEDVVYKITDEEKTNLTNTMKNFNASEYLSKRGWFDQEGNPNVLKISEDVYKLENEGKMIGSVATQIKTATRKEVISRDIKNIDMDDKSSSDFKVSKPFWQVAMEAGE